MTNVIAGKFRKRRSSSRNPPIPPVELWQSLPTPQRLARAGPDVEIGGNDRSGKIVRMADTPLERMFARKAISPREYAALQRYRHHWYHGGLLPSLGSVDLNRIIAPDLGNMTGMAKSESQAHHRACYRDANKILGMRAVGVVDRVVCQEWALEAAGNELGWPSKGQAIAAACEVLRDAGARLAILWGI